MNSPELTPAGPRFARRVSSAPTPINPSRAADSPDHTSSSPLVETLIVQPGVKIVQFSTSGQAVLEDVAAARQEAGTWPPWSRTERTIAMGTLSIYRGPGSVAFLNCGSALQPILPKSQCWCIDESNATFVLQIRRPNYWRIELGISPGEQQKSVGLKDVLADILQFEKTYCPFQRSFTIDISEESLIEGKKKAWTPKGVLSIPSSPSTTGGTTDGAPGDLTPVDRPVTPAHAITSHDAPRPSSPDVGSERPRIEIGPQEESGPAEEPRHTEVIIHGLSPLRLGVSSLSDDNNDHSSVGSYEHDTAASSVNDAPSSPTSTTVSSFPEMGSPSKSERDATSGGTRPQSAASDQSPQEDLVLTERPGVDFEETETPTVSSDSNVVIGSSREDPATNTPDQESKSSSDEIPPGRDSPTPSQDSFHSIDSRRTSLIAPAGQVERNESPPAATLGALRLRKRDQTPQSSQIEPHQPISREPPRSLPLSNSVLSATSSHLSLVARTGELLLGPPAYLIALMVKIAAKITRGGWKGPRLAYDYSDDDVPVFYDFSDSDLSE